MNKFIFRTEGAKQVVTLLTGKLTFQEAQDLSKAILEKRSEPIEWLDASGKPIAKSIGELKVVRPMPVGCDGKPSGVVLTTTFLTMSKPSQSMTVKITPELTVVFEEQK